MIQRARDEAKITVSDYRIMPEGPPYYQLVDGELYMTPAPRIRHQDVIGKLYTKLDGHVTARGLGRVFIAPTDVYASEHDVFQPDILFVAAANASRIEDDGVHGLPDLVVEVLSPSTRALDLGRKRARYAAFGVIEAWYVDLEAEAVMVYRLLENAAAPARTLGRGDAVMSALLPELEVAVEAVIEAR